MPDRFEEWAHHQVVAPVAAVQCPPRLCGQDVAVFGSFSTAAPSCSSTYSNCLVAPGPRSSSPALLERKAILRQVVPPQPSRILYVDHVAGRGVDLYRAACELDLEGIVAKWALAPYGTEPPSWAKIKNPTYSQGCGSAGPSVRLASHRSRLVRDHLESLRGHIEVEYLPAYAPELNPVEYIWGYGRPCEPLFWNGQTLGREESR